MKMYLILILVFSFSFEALAFTLISPSYELSNPTSTTVNVASGACRGNGVPDSELYAAISTSVAYWNDVPDSILKMKVGSEVTRTLSDVALPGEILVGCRSLTGANGVSIKDDANGSAVVSLNANTLVPGGYLPGAIEKTLTHELGHALGLGHSSDTSSIMISGSVYSGLPAHLSEDDKSGVRYLYPTEGYLLGLLGGCSALAYGERNTTVSSYRIKGLFLEAFFFLSLLGFVRVLRSRRNLKSKR